MPAGAFQRRGHSAGRLPYLNVTCRRQFSTRTGLKSTLNVEKVENKDIQLLKIAFFFYIFYFPSSFKNENCHKTLYNGWSNCISINNNKIIFKQPDRPKKIKVQKRRIKEALTSENKRIRVTKERSVYRLMWLSVLSHRWSLVTIFCEN